MQDDDPCSWAAMLLLAAAAAALPALPAMPARADLITDRNIDSAEPVTESRIGTPSAACGMDQAAQAQVVAD